ncbi:MAG TPA: RNA chaperone Hfq [Candidatus Aquilonibacter sp.]|nr:RNA chaperone Hfq [Candidatus Aquilonibacter sp.]
MTDVLDSPSADANSFNGTRKLVRPHLPARDRRYEAPFAEDPLSHALQDTMPSLEASHAEAFYFQKQMQQQTGLTVVLEDGEQIHGVLEWYDRCVIKLRAGRQRVLIYKAGIKYLFKTSELHAHNSIMK